MFTRTKVSVVASALGLGVSLLAGLLTIPSQPATAPLADLESLIAQLGAEDYALREQATLELIARGPSVAAVLQERLARERDPEIALRLEYVLENVIPPQRAVLVLRASAESGIEAGDLITHVGSRRVRSVGELRGLLSRGDGGTFVRVSGRRGPRQAGPLDHSDLLELANYVAPRGEAIVRAVRAYADGYAERAHEILQGLGESIPAEELPPLLAARIAYTAGEGTAALRMLDERTDAVRPLGRNEWTAPSALDVSGPGPSPFHLNWVLLTRANAAAQSGSDPDLRVQRVLVPAHRYADALRRCAALWTTLYRDALHRPEESTRIPAGNMLAVAAWMFHELDLRSECTRLIGPRSAILGYTWMRVDTDAWLTFLAGDARGAVDRFYSDAQQLLQRPPGDGQLTRNPLVAARIAFFLYQVPDDPRVEEMLKTIIHGAQSVLPEYVHWMLRALNASNEPVIRRHLATILPVLPDSGAAECARAVALLEYVQPRPDPEVLATAAQRLAQSTQGAQHELWSGVCQALQHLAGGRPAQARAALEPLSAWPEVAALGHTLDYLEHPPEQAAATPELASPLLAVPLAHAQEWLLLTRQRRLVRLEASGAVQPVDDPGVEWFPGPLNWPWVGREPESGRVWVYDRRRVIEIPAGPAPAVRFNIAAEAIRAFHHHLSEAFSQVAEAVRAAPAPRGECGEFLRQEVVAHAEHVSDPDLPELGVIESCDEGGRLVWVAFRGGPDLLIDAQRRRVWSATWFQQRLGLPAAPRFFVQAQPADAGASGPDPVVWLMSDCGLIRFDIDREEAERIALPGDAPHPALVPESTPYVRRDPRFVYCARLPAEGGGVYRVWVADRRVEAVDMVNEALPEHYYATWSRAAIRAHLDEMFAREGLPPVQEFIHDAAEVVRRWQEGAAP